MPAWVPIMCRHGAGTRHAYATQEDALLGGHHFGEVIDWESSSVGQGNYRKQEAEWAARSRPMDSSLALAVI